MNNQTGRLRPPGLLKRRMIKWNNFGKNYYDVEISKQFTKGTFKYISIYCRVVLREEYENFEIAVNSADSYKAGERQIHISLLDFLNNAIENQHSVKFYLNKAEVKSYRYLLDGIKNKLDEILSFEWKGFNQEGLYQPNHQDKIS